MIIRRENDLNRRDYYFDNARFFLIFLVFFGHSIQPFIEDSNAIYSLYMVIYTFHMPAFVLISGYFTKNFRRKGYITKLFKKLIIPFLIFQLVYTIYYYFLFDKPDLSFQIVEPRWSLWYLLSLFCWNLLLILFANLKRTISIPLSIIIGLLVGGVDVISNEFSLSRTFVFFPIFLIGYYLERNHFTFLLQSKGIKAFSLFLFAIAYTLFYHYPFQQQWLFGSKSYAELDATFIEGFFIRFIVYVLNFTFMTAFMSLVTERQIRFTHIGRYTLYIYLLHGFIVQPFRQSFIIDLLEGIWIIIVCGLLSFFGVLFLSSKFITTLFQPIVELRVKKIKEWRMNQMKKRG